MASNSNQPLRPTIFSRNARTGVELPHQKDKLDIIRDQLNDQRLDESNFNPVHENEANLSIHNK